MGEDVTVIHKVGTPFTMQAEIDGNKGERECLPAYYNTPSCCSTILCPGAIKKTALKAKAIQVGGAPSVEEIVR